MSNITIGNEHLSVEVSALGAEMQSLVGRDGRSWLWHGDAAFWTGRSPILFPIVGKAPDDHVSIGGVRYPMGQHGFARRSEFVLTGSGSDFCRFELAASAQSRASYPFEFLLSVEHRLVGRAVEVTAEVTNRDTRPMPYGIGFHPAFVWPLPGCEGLDHMIWLDNGASPPLARLVDGLVDPQPMPSPFVDGALLLERADFTGDTMIFLKGAGSGLIYGAGDAAVQLRWENLPNLAFWSKQADAPFLCLEPWHGTAAAVGRGDGIEARPSTVVLGAGETGRYRFVAEVG
jgi:galactose mutarotase-like enzyme